MLMANKICKTVATADGELHILSDVDLQIGAAESIAIVGASGSGKSTLLGLLAGLDTVTSGRIDLGEFCITELSEEQRAAVRSSLVGFVFQSFHLLPSLTALENVMLPQELKGVKEAKAIAEGFLARVGLAHRLKHYPKQLSGGEQQRVAIARAFASMPTVLFADEPTGNLDTATGEQIIELLFNLNREEHTTLILVTHDIRLAQRCERVIELSEGRVVNSAKVS